MYKATKFRLYPNNEQTILIEKHFGCARVVYNYFLDYRQKQFALGNKANYMITQKELTIIKKQEKYIWLNEVGSQSLQMALRNLDNAYTKFFKNTGKYPKFKSKKDSYQSFTAPQSISLSENKVHLPKFTKGIKCKIHRGVFGEIKQATISRYNGKYYVSILIDDKKELPTKVQPKNSVGLDMGLTDFIITSDGVKYANKRYFKKSQERLAKAQKSLSKKVKGSSNRKKAIAKVQNIHTKITNQRLDYLHKISNEITNQYDIVNVESLNIKGMVRNGRLSKAISDVSWGEFIRLLEYKCEWKGKHLVKIDKWFPSSQLCSDCGCSSGKKTLDIREWTCQGCGTIHDRDINAAKNINKYGVGSTLYACGISVSLKLSNDRNAVDVEAGSPSL